MSNPKRSIQDIMRDLREEVLGHGSATNMERESQSSLSLPHEIDVQLNLVHLTSRFKGSFGKFLIKVRRFGYRLFAKWVLDPMAAQQSSINIAFLRQIQKLDANQHELRGMLIELLDAVKSGMDTHVAASTRSIEQRFEALEKQLSRLGTSVDSVSNRDWEKELEIIQDKVRTLSGLMATTIVNQKHFQSQAGSLEQMEGEDNPEGLNYSLVMEPFQAPQETVIRSFDVYVERYFSTESGKIVDLGCGKGAFLEAAHRRGIEVIGIDSDPINVAICNGLGLHAIEADVLAYLQSLNDGSLSGVFMAHLIEHFDVEGKRRLMALVARKLKHGGIVVIETPNTSSVRVMTGMYYLDPTHCAPLHPEAYKRMFELSGFITVDSFLAGEFEGIGANDADPNKFMNFVWAGRRKS